VVKRDVLVLVVVPLFPALALVLVPLLPLLDIMKTVDVSA